MTAPPITLNAFGFPLPPINTQNILPTFCLDNGVYNVRLPLASWNSTGRDSLAKRVAENRSLLDDGLRLLMEGDAPDVARTVLERQLGEDYYSAQLNQELHMTPPSIGYDTQWLTHRKLLQPSNANDPLPIAWPLALKTMFATYGWPSRTTAIEVDTALTVAKAAAAVYTAELCTGSRPVLNDVCYHACTGVAPSAPQAKKLAALKEGGTRPAQLACVGASTDDTSCRTCDTAALQFCQATGADDVTQRPFLDPLVVQRCACLATPLLTQLRSLSSQSINPNAAIACVDGGTCGQQGYMTQVVMDAASNCGTTCTNLFNISTKAASLTVNDVTQSCRIVTSDDVLQSDKPFQGLTFTMNEEGKLTLSKVTSLKPVVPPAAGWWKNVTDYVQHTPWTPTFAFAPDTPIATMLKKNEGFLILIGACLGLLFLLITVLVALRKKHKHHV